MMKRILIGLVICMLYPALSHAQEASIEMVFDRDTVSKGSLVNADVFVRQGENIAGMDVLVEVDPTCIRIERMNPGSYLPVEAEDGGFSLVNEATDSSARLAVSVINRDRVVSGDGLFMRIPMRILCDLPQEAISVSRAELVNDLGDQYSAATQINPLTVGAGDPRTSEPSIWLLTLAALAVLLLGVLSAFLWKLTLKRVN